MLRTNSKQAIENIRASIQDYIDERMDDPELDGYEHNAWNMKNIFIDEMWHEVARIGEFGAFDSWVQGLGFGDFMNVRGELMSWLEETEEEADRFSHDEQEALYRNLLAREFEKMAQVPKEGVACEVTPYVAKGGYQATLKLYKDGELVGQASGLEPVPANKLRRKIEAVVNETGMFPEVIEPAKHSAADISERLKYFHDSPSAPLYNPMNVHFEPGVVELPPDEIVNPFPKAEQGKAATPANQQAAAKKSASAQARTASPARQQGKVV